MKGDFRPKYDFEVLLLSGRFELRGSTTQMLHLAEQLPEHGIGTSILCPSAHQLDPARRRSIRVFEYPYLDTPLLRRLVLEFLRRDLEDHPPDLIHIQSRRMLQQGIWLARELERPFVLTIHDYIPSDEKLEFDNRWGREVIAVSESVHADLLSHDAVPSEKVSVVRSGVKPYPPEEITSVLPPNRIPVIGTAGPLEDVKGIPYFLQAAKKVTEQRPDVEFLIAGSGPEEAALRKLSRELKLTSHITFVPNLHDFNESLRAMDVFCLPSLKQGLGTIMLEAMAMGKPVVASRVGGVFSIIEDDVSGQLVPPSNSDAMASAILDFLNDPAKARSIGEAGRQKVLQDFRLERMVDETIQVYDRALDTKQPPMLTVHRAEEE